MRDLSWDVSFTFNTQSVLNATQCADLSTMSKFQSNEFYITKDCFVHYMYYSVTLKTATSVTLYRQFVHEEWPILYLQSQCSRSLCIGRDRIGMMEPKKWCKNYLDMDQWSRIYVACSAIFWSLHENRNSTWQECCRCLSSCLWNG